MKRFLVLLCALMLVFGMAGSASALLYSYDFSSIYTSWESVEGDILDYATLTSEAGDLWYDSGHGGGISAGFGATSDYYFDFSVAVNEVSFRAGDGAGDYDAFAITLYEFGTDNLIGTWSSPLFGGDNEPEWYTLTVAQSNIGRVVFDPGNSGVLPGVLGPPELGGVVITDFSYDTASVPEPLTILLLGFGLVGLAGLRRKV